MKEDVVPYIILGGGLYGSDWCACECVRQLARVLFTERYSVCFLSGRDIIFRALANVLRSVYFVYVCVAYVKSFNIVCTLTAMIDVKLKTNIERTQ